MMQILLDTNVFLWYFWGSNRIVPIRELLDHENTDIFISAVSFWEITIKKRAGKLPVDIEKIRSFAKENMFSELPITSNYFKAYLELAQYHKDPFDHMLLAQAITSPMRFITGDEHLAEYSSLVMVI